MLAVGVLKLGATLSVVLLHMTHADTAKVVTRHMRLCAVQRAPKILEAPHACASILRLWVSALLDRKGRPAAQQLTLVLASNASTSLLFSGIQPEEVTFSGFGAIPAVCSQASSCYAHAFTI